MVGDGRLLPRSGRARSLAGAGRESFRLAVKLARSEGSLLAGEQSGDRTQHRVEVLPAAEVPRQGPPVLQVADAVLDADPLSRVSPTFAPVRRGESGGTGSWFFRRARRGVTTAPAVCAPRPW